MKTIRSIFVLSFTVISLALTGFVNSSSKTTLVKAADTGFAVVELFTSEGCSTCPAADEVIAKVEKEYTNKPVYILAYHVDYWNRLGWKDVFSSPDFSKRQRTYAAWLKLKTLYTPQVIVNGRTEFVGSEEATLRNAINSGLKQKAETKIVLSNFKQNARNATVQYNTDAPLGSKLVLALVQKNAVVAVKAGENKGHTLSHVQIVSNVQNVSVSAATGEATVKLPATFKLENFELIAFLQDTSNGNISTATRLDLISL